MIDFSPIIASARRVRTIADQMLQGRDGDLELAKDELTCMRKVFEGWEDNDLRLVTLNWTDNALALARNCRAYDTISQLGSTVCAIEVLIEVLNKTPAMQEFF